MPRRTRKIPLKKFTRCHPSSKKTKRCLPDSVYSNMSYAKAGCNDGEDHCLLDKSTLPEETKKEYRKQYLRPRRPKVWDTKPNTWLDNFNIMHVMKQYEEAVPWFKFLGIFPIDFSAPNPYKKDKQECLYKETCSLNLKEEYAKGVRGIGMIFNLDPHYKGGSHWVALYIRLDDITKPFVGYFDSYGYAVPPLIARLMRSFKLQISTCELGTNARRFQRGTSECGMFSIYFLICMMSGIMFKDFCKDSVNDATMLELRKILFSK